MANTKLKKRINISVSDDINKVLTALAKKEQIPVATKTLDLLRKALQIEEDSVLDALAQERDTKNAKYIPHERVWR